MCTAISWPQRDHYFGRTLDLEHSFGEQVILTPRYFPLSFRHLPPQEKHYALLGMGVHVRGTPLYFDAVNEMGLCAAGLNFPGCCHYHPPRPGLHCPASFELIDWLLGQCAGVEQAAALLKGCVITGEAFGPEYAATPLHWLLADSQGSLVVESTAGGIQLYEGQGVLTNAPAYPEQLSYAAQFASLSPACANNDRGGGSRGLPGDFSSRGRFARGSFLQKHCHSRGSEEECVQQFFHMMDLLQIPGGCVRPENGKTVITQYTCCCNADKGIYYYTTAGNRRICGVDLHNAELKGNQLLCYPLRTRPDFRMEGQSRLTETIK